MISICIPVYNHDVTQLANSLSQQINSINGFKSEILIGDDCSQKAFLEQYKVIQTFAHTKVLQAPYNLGRSKIRNWIASNAKYDYLLFIDGDCLMKSDNYLKNYLKEIQNKRKVVIGGIAYDLKLADNSYILRWKYGHQRETKIDFLRQEMSFLSSNFLIEKNTFNQFKFNESFEVYGHEDSLLGLTLRHAGIPIIQLNNPVIHAGLEPGATFVEKTKSSIINLKILAEKTKGMKITSKSILLKIQERQINKLLLSMGNITYLVSKKLMIANLCGKRPSLFVFDLFKLLYLIHCKYTNQLEAN